MGGALRFFIDQRWSMSLGVDSQGGLDLSDTVAQTCRSCRFGVWLFWSKTGRAEVWCCSCLHQPFPLITVGWTWGQQPRVALSKWSPIRHGTVEIQTFFKPCYVGSSSLLCYPHEPVILLTTTSSIHLFPKVTSCWFSYCLAQWLGIVFLEYIYGFMKGRKKERKKERWMFGEKGGEVCEAASWKWFTVLGRVSGMHWEGLESSIAFPTHCLPSVLAFDRLPSSWVVPGPSLCQSSSLWYHNSSHLGPDSFLSLVKPPFSILRGSRDQILLYHLGFLPPEASTSCPSVLHHAVLF